MADSAYKIDITGIVQGVGFRPFIYRLAKKFELNGYVTNTLMGVHVYVEGAQHALDNFAKSIEPQSPNISSIEDMQILKVAPIGAKSFTIEKSEKLSGNEIFISPDLSTCADCKSDILDESNRRYRYPFTTCTYCGPRYSIIRDVPYDRSSTVMDEFTMCPACQSEYDDPNDRRYHSQPNACAVCGPKLSLYNTKDKACVQVGDGDYISLIADALKRGQIVALKGLGGYQLCCDASNSDALAALRERKHREAKPFAVMCKDVLAAQNHCHISPEETELLLSPHNPIVLMEKRKASTIADNVSSDNDYLGVMLPYTPIHILLMEIVDTLVMTSANISDMPIISDDEDAKANLADIADYILMHNRKIHRRVDDSVYKVTNELPQAIRRARGYAPGIVKADKLKTPILAVGAELKNTFAVSRGSNIFVSPHIGDLKYAQTYELFKQSIHEFKQLFGVSPKVVACDMHPGYLSTKWASESGHRVIKVQHHHAHLAATLLEYGIMDEPAIGFCMDGTGYGTDGAIWGCEAGIVSFKQFKRISHLGYFALPGGDICAKDVYRCGVSLINQAVGRVDANQYEFLQDIASQNIQVIQEMIEQNINTVPTSSMGRLFDGVSSIIGLGSSSLYEAGAAIRLESVADKSITDAYTVSLREYDGLHLWMWESMIGEILLDLEEKTPIGTISAKFHNSVIEYIIKMTQIISRQSGITKVALSGGVFNNSLISDRAEALLRGNGYEVYLQRTFPAGDGGLCIGQLIAANEVI
ncbi:MAG: carbamoyltransferase HypF [Clostridia bacterium]|jgi:hydrogenase maturation protein HypF|nr:carbamoyltransferase HypF [Clostridia bacterium]MBT7123395.1 carbamoyltransferase HypF [Clostridia bacterium]